MLKFLKGENNNLKLLLQNKENVYNLHYDLSN